jgi:hypothetical protein
VVCGVGPGAARTIILFHITSARPSKQPLMSRAFRKVYGGRLRFLILQEQLKDIIIKQHVRPDEEAKTSRNSRVLREADIIFLRALNALTKGEEDVRGDVLRNRGRVHQGSQMSLEEA